MSGTTDFHFYLDQFPAGFLSVLLYVSSSFLFDFVKVIFFSSHSEALSCKCWIFAIFLLMLLIYHLKEEVILIFLLFPCGLNAA